jgi:dethiobiotin synthetase
MNNLRGVFVTGTDTDVGKTHIGAAIIPLLVAKGISVIPRKPVESGCEVANDNLIPTDAVKLHVAAGQPEHLDEVCAYRLRHALSPERAARLEDVDLTIANLERAARNGVDAARFVWVEGAGGFYSPLASDGLNADLAKRLGLPVLLVAADRLGCINHVLLTVEAIEARGLNLAAVVLNQNTPDERSAMNNADDLKQHLNCSLFKVDHCETSDASHSQLAPLLALLVCCFSKRQ